MGTILRRMRRFMEPWEALDIDDSDLSDFRRLPKHQALIDPPIPPPPSLLRPCSRRSLLSQQSQQQSKHRNPDPPNSQTLDSQDPNPVSFLPPPQRGASSLDREGKWKRRIPGPAGAVQAAMWRKERRLGGLLRGEDAEEAMVPTQEYIRRVVENGDEDDGDFEGGAWLYAVDHIRREGLVDGGGAAIGTPLCSIKSGQITDKVSQVVALVKSCTPNGLGDLRVTLKDPTGTIGATIHHKVTREKGLAKEISVGAVLILQKVSIFSPSCSARYLNITSNNIIQVIAKDTRPLSKENRVAAAKGHFSSSENYEKSSILEKPVSPPMGRIEGIMSSLKQAANTTGKTVSHGQCEWSGGEKQSQSWSDQSSRNHNAALERQPSQMCNDSCSQLRAARSGTETINRNIREDFSSVDCEPQNQVDRSSSGAIEGSNNRLYTKEMSDNKGGGTVNEVESQKQQLISRTSLLQWTDEQLQELLDCD